MGNADAWSNALQRLIGAGHAYADILDYTLAQTNAFVAAIDRQESRRLANLLTVTATGAQGDGDAIRKALLTSPKRPEEKTPTGKPTEDMQRIACVVSGGQWVNGQCEKKSADAEKDTTGARLAVVKAQAESEFKVLKEGLDLQKSALDRSLDDRLVSIRDYYARKTRIEQQAIDQELAAKQQELAAQSEVGWQ